ncbi:uncharacterized protein LOC126904240 isoform X2 [Daktulosphaira vitifoliae]|uniref:uncharacterized protein LOC126904240 isoform X2 n=1 Tax=Daktulosphaira vitifoliae TaxID=58002 RepID=UPI0021A993FB|nr:uncharacterized protein LOC126904240 isoform X2 [Daktulosphaira vitifoliae]
MENKILPIIYVLVTIFIKYGVLHNTNNELQELINLNKNYAVSMFYDCLEDDKPYKNSIYNEHFDLQKEKENIGKKLCGVILEKKLDLSDHADTCLNKVDKCVDKYHINLFAKDNKLKVQPVPTKENNTKKSEDLVIDELIKQFREGKIPCFGSKLSGVIQKEKIYLDEIDEMDEIDLNEDKKLKSEVFQDINFNVEKKLLTWFKKSFKKSTF